MSDDKYDRQFLAWALDRAIEIFKLQEEAPSIEEALKAAERICDWLIPVKDAVEISEDKDMEPTHETH